VVAVGESSAGDLKTRPDYAVSARNALAGFIELKAPGKGAEPRKFAPPGPPGAPALPPPTDGAPTGGITGPNGERFRPI
jgi:hypothetical protein